MFDDATMIASDGDSSSKAPSPPLTPGASALGPSGPELSVIVETGKKVGVGIGSHVEFTCVYRTSLPRFCALTGQVARRFREFKWLHQALVEEWCVVSTERATTRR
jgi:hypothetical protein